MCTAVTYRTEDFYFGRTLDNDFSYAEEVVVAPRNYPFRFRLSEEICNHYAVIGTAYVPDGYPLYYDAVNEKGLCIAGLNFVGNAFYGDEVRGMINLAQFELIPYLLCRCACVNEAVELLGKINLTAEAYGKGLPSAQLHWLVADKSGAVTVEFVRSGLKIYDNPAGVLANNPPFDVQLFQLSRYMGLSPREPQNTFSEKLTLSSYGRGLGAVGLPGDLSSPSRFVRAVFTKLNSVSGSSEEESVNQFFHILGSVEQQRGCCIVGENGYETTVYSSCCNADKGIYYYTTYENHAISAVDMRRENLEGSALARYPLRRKERVFFHN